MHMLCILFWVTNSQNMFRRYNGAYYIVLCPNFVTRAFQFPKEIIKLLPFNKATHLQLDCWLFHFYWEHTDLVLLGLKRDPSVKDLNHWEDSHLLAKHRSYLEIYQYHVIFLILLGLCVEFLIVSLQNWQDVLVIGHGTRVVPD